MAKGNMSPTNGWAAQSEVGTRRAKIYDAGKACFVRGGTSSLKRCQTLRGTVLGAARSKDCGTNAFLMVAIRPTSSSFPKFESYQAAVSSL